MVIHLARIRLLGCNLIATLLLALTVLASQPAAAADLEPYLLQPGDVLQISVWKESNLQTDALVRPDGGLTFPLSGEHQAAGLTVDALRQAIEERLRKYIPDPVVTVSLRVLGGNRIYVVGKVNRPGEYPFNRPLDIMQSLGVAGGATPFAALNDIRVLRRENGKQTVIAFKYEEVERGRNLSQNILLKSGDTVVVP